MMPNYTLSFGIRVCSLITDSTVYDCTMVKVRSPHISWCQQKRLVTLGRAVVCDCGTPWTFLLPFFARLQVSKIPFLRIRVLNMPKESK